MAEGERGVKVDCKFNRLEDSKDREKYSQKGLYLNILGTRYIRVLWSSKKTPYLKTLPLTLKCFLITNNSSSGGRGDGQLNTGTRICCHAI